MKKIAFITLLSLIAISCKTDTKETEPNSETAEVDKEITETKVSTTTLTENGIGITPISHASLILNWDNTVCMWILLVEQKHIKTKNNQMLF